MTVAKMRDKLNGRYGEPSWQEVGDLIEIALAPPDASEETNKVFNKGIMSLDETNRMRQDLEQCRAALTAHVALVKALREDNEACIAQDVVEKRRDATRHGGLCT